MLVLSLHLRMLTTFAKTANVSNKPGLTLENAGDYRGALNFKKRVVNSGGEPGETWWFTAEVWEWTSFPQMKPRSRPGDWNDMDTSCPVIQNWSDLK